MINLHDICYVRIGSSRFSESVDFAKNVVGLELVDEQPGAAYLRGDKRNHDLCILEGDPRNHTAGFELDTEADLALAMDELKSKGFDVSVGDDKGCRDRRVEAYINFHDLTGNSIDLTVRPQHSTHRYFPSRDAGITEFNHIGLNSTDPVRDEKFWLEVMGAKVSDWIGKSPLLRIDKIHHKVALFATDRPGIQHINFQVATVDDIMRNWYYLAKRGTEIAFGPGRHQTSGAYFLYYYGPDNIIYEYSCGCREIDETTWRARQFPAEDKSFCSWGASNNIKEFQS